MWNYVIELCDYVIRIMWLCDYVKLCEKNRIT